MALRKTYITKATAKAFTLIEILVVMSLFIATAGLGLFVSMDSYRGFMSRNERDVIVNILQKARSQAINNMCFGTCTGGKAHGVHFGSGQYVVFQGNTYNAGDANNEIIPAENKASVVTGPDVVFSPLAATTTGATITISAPGTVGSSIMILSEGAITWTN